MTTRTEVRLDRDSDLGIALTRTPFDGQRSHFLVLKDDLGNVSWSGVINHWSTAFTGFTGSAPESPIRTITVELEDTQEWVNARIEAAEEGLAIRIAGFRAGATKAGVL